MTINLLALTIGSSAIIIFSWFYSLRSKRYHGITRFFSFEAIFILFLLNYSMWFKNPFSVAQVFSWIALCASAYAGLAGFITLGKHGKSEGDFENTTVLVKKGIYRFIRHPLYCSLFLLGTGIMLKDPQPIQIILGIINLISVWFTAKIEEKEMLSRFGEEYSEYMRETKMFIPIII